MAITLLSILVMIVILGIIFWAGKAVMAAVPMDPLFRILAIAVFAIICIIIAFYYVLLPLLHALPGV